MKLSKTATAMVMLAVMAGTAAAQMAPTVKTVANAVKKPTDIPPPLNRFKATTVTVNITAQEVVAEIVPATLNTDGSLPTATIPGPATLRATTTYSSVLYAPHAGTVVQRNIVAGQYVSEGEKLITIVDPSVLWFRFDIYQRDLPWYEPGQTLQLTVEGCPAELSPQCSVSLSPR